MTLSKQAKEDLFFGGYLFCASTMGFQGLWSQDGRMHLYCILRLMRLVWSEQEVYVRDHGFFKTWSEEEKWSIAVKELLAIIYACVHTDGKGRD